MHELNFSYREEHFPECYLSYLETQTRQHCPCKYPLIRPLKTETDTGRGSARTECVLWSHRYHGYHVPLRAAQSSSTTLTYIPTIIPSYQPSYNLPNHHIYHHTIYQTIIFTNQPTFIPTIIQTTNHNTNHNTFDINNQRF